MQSCCSPRSRSKSGDAPLRATDRSLVFPDSSRESTATEDNPNDLTQMQQRIGKSMTAASPRGESSLRPSGQDESRYIVSADSNSSSFNLTLTKITRQVEACHSSQQDTKVYLQRVVHDISMRLDEDMLTTKAMIDEAMSRIDNMEMPLTERCEVLEDRLKTPPKPVANLLQPSATLNELDLDLEHYESGRSRMIGKTYSGVDRSTQTSPHPIEIQYASKDDRVADPTDSLRSAVVNSDLNQSEVQRNLKDFDARLVDLEARIFDCEQKNPKSQGPEQPLGEQSSPLKEDSEHARDKISMSVTIDPYSGYPNIVWNVDSRKLKSGDSRALSPLFEMPLGKENLMVPFKIIIYPSVEGATRGSAAFKNAHGRGRITIKCEGEIAGTSAQISFSLAIGCRGELDMRHNERTYEHDFARSAICTLSRLDVGWNLSSVVDEKSQTFSVFMKLKHVHS